MLWRNALIMYDKETGSEWSHYTGLCMKGEHKGETLKVIQSIPRVNYGDWLKLHKNTKVLTHQNRDEDVKDVYKKYHESDRIGRVPLEHKDERLSLKSKIIGVWNDKGALAVPYEYFVGKDFVETSFQNEKIIIYKNEKSQISTVWKIQVDKDITLLSNSVDKSLIKDNQGNSWDLRTGKALKGDGKLVAVNHMLTYWFSWRDFYPQSVVLEVASDDKVKTK